MAISKAAARSTKQAVLSGDELVSPVLDGTSTVYTFELTGPASKITLQSSDSLAFDYEVSVNGKNFVTGASVVAGALSSYSTHNISTVKVTRTGGTGKVSLAAT
jgi:hypothetical protein